MVKKRGNGCGTCLKHNALTLATVIFVIKGVILGVVLRNVKHDWTEREVGKQTLKYYSSTSFVPK